MIKTKSSVHKVEVLLRRLFGSEKPYQDLGPKVLKQLEGREINGTGGVGALKQDVNSALTCLCVTVPLVVHGDSKEMCADVHFVPLYFPRDVRHCSVDCSVGF